MEHLVKSSFACRDHGGRGVYVPEGMTAAQIMMCAELLERDFAVAPFISRQMVRAVLEMAMPLKRPAPNEERESASEAS
jgi:hypothetical protein